jgi:TetR/AcrR family transcriptional regulator, mexJK operon transcriptional repressor
MSEQDRGTPARRGRPTLRQAEELDGRILDAAAACFLASGFDATTMEAIAARAGVTKTTLYLRHPDKAAVLRAVLEDRLAAWSAISQKTDWMLGATLASRLRYLARLMAEKALDPEVHSFVKLVDRLHGAADVIAQDYWHMLRRPMLERIAAEIAEFATADGFPARDPEAAAATFPGMLSGHLLLSRRGTAEQVRAFADYAVDIFLEGRARW